MKRFEPVKRFEPTAQERLALLIKYKFQCAHCKKPFTPENRPEFHHVISRHTIRHSPTWQFDPNDWVVPLCGVCHSVVTVFQVTELHAKDPRTHTLWDKIVDYREIGQTFTLRQSVLLVVPNRENERIRRLYPLVKAKLLFFVQGTQLEHVSTEEFPALNFPTKSGNATRETFRRLK